MREITQHAISDEILIQRVAALDEDAFTQIYQRYAQRMLAYFYRMLNHDAEQAQDFVQELFLKIMEKADSFQPHLKFSTWMFTMAANMCKNEYRKRTVRNKFSVMSRQQTSAFDPELEKKIDHASFRKELSQALDVLSPEQKQVFILRYQEGLSLKEISKISQCAEGTVKSRIYYGLQKLSKQLAVFRTHD